MALGSTHKMVHTLENRYKTNTEKANSIIMNYVKYMRVHILTDRTSLTIPSPLNKHEMWRYSVPVLLVLFFLFSASFLSHFCTFFCFFLSGDPPRLFLLDKFDTVGVGACLKLYTNPSFFKSESASSGPVKLQVQRKKKIRKGKKKRYRWRGFTSDTCQIASVVFGRSC